MIMSPQRVHVLQSGLVPIDTRWSVSSVSP